MHRRLSSLVPGSSKSKLSVYDDDDRESKTSTVLPPKDEPLPIPSLKVKRVDHYYSKWYKQWRYRVCSSSHSHSTVLTLSFCRTPAPRSPSRQSPSCAVARTTFGRSSPLCEHHILHLMYSLLTLRSIIRRMPRNENLEATFKVIIKSPYLIEACKDVIKTWPGISWNSDPLEVNSSIPYTVQCLTP